MSNKIAVIDVYINDEYFSKALDLLTLEYDYKNRGREYWFERFSKSTHLDKVGFLLEVNNVICGFLGVIGSIEIKGLSVWYVNSEYRRYSIEFLRIALSRLSGLIVNSSANPTAFRVFCHFGFINSFEYIGIPKKIFGWIGTRKLKLYDGMKYFVVYNENLSLFQLVFLIFSKMKLGFFLATDDTNLITLKIVNVLFKGGDYFFPLSICGDRYE
jgi:hypothetical protein